MKRIFKLIILITLCTIGSWQLQGQIPNFDWVGQLGGTATDVGNSIAYDDAGNVYTTGGFLNTVDFDPGSGIYNLTSSGNRDIFIQKLDAAGDFLWAKKIGGTAKDEGLSISIGPSGDIYIIGVFSDTVDFDTGTGQSIQYATGSYDIYIQKLDSNGNFLWVKTFGGASIDSGESLTVDDSGNVYATGFFRGIIDFDPGVGIVNLDAVDAFGDIFILKLNSNGDYVWVKHIDGNYSEYGNSIAIDTSRNVYVTGTFSGTVDFDPSATGVESRTSVDFDIFVLKLNALGNYVWVKQMGGSGSESGASIAVNISGDIYTTGGFSSPIIDFDPGVGTTNFSSQGWNDIFIQKLDSNGNFVWAKQMGSIEDDHGNAIALDESGSVYVTGNFKDSVDFNPNVGTDLLVSSGYQDIFIQKLDSNGEFLWVHKIGGASSDEGHAIAVDVDKSIYVTGGFMSNVDFDPGSGFTSLSANGSYDTYVLKLSACYPTVLTPELATLPDVLGVCSAINTFIPQANNDCDLLVTATTSTSFPITTQGTTVVEWTYNDGFGTVLTQNQNFIVSDSTDPVPDNGILDELSATCIVNLTDVEIPTGIDDCAGAITASANVTFPITDPFITEIIWTLDDSNGNARVLTQNIVWSIINTETTINDQTITSSHTSGTFQWLDCNNNQPINGENGQSFTATTNGSYALEITENDCIDTTACIVIENVGIEAINLLNEVVVSPNPTSNNIEIQLGNAIDLVEISLTDLLGRVVFTEEYSHINKANVEVTGQAGVYLLTIKTNGVQKTIEVVKQ